MIRAAAVLLSAGLLASCTIRYQAEEYVLSAGRVQAFDVAGAVTVESAQAESEPRNLWAPGGAGSTRVLADYSQITAQLADQVLKEIGANGRNVGAGPAKTVRLKVLYAMAGNHGFVTLFGSMDVLVMLGNGESFILHAGNKTPGSVLRAMNGTVAIAVIEILKHPKVRTYLASTAPRG